MRLSAMVAASLLLACSSPQPGEVTFEGDVANPTGTHAFHWLNESTHPHVHVLEVIDLTTRGVVFRDDHTYRTRDVNVAAWSSSPSALLVYSGDVGTAALVLEDGVVTLENVQDRCVPGSTALRDAVRRRLPVCP